MCFELSKLYTKNSLNEKKYYKVLSTKKEFNGFMTHLIKDLQENGFLYPKSKSKGMILNIRNMFMFVKNSWFDTKKILKFEG